MKENMKEKVEAVCRKDFYKGKLFSILGDSVSTLEGYSEPKDAVFYEGFCKLQAGIFAPRDTWWGQVIEHLGGEMLVNNSISGSMVCKHRSCVIPSYGCSDERTSSLGKGIEAPDVIMIFLGINDWGCAMKPTPADHAEESDTSIFSAAYKCMLEKLKKNYPLAELWCFTLPLSIGKTQDGYFIPCRGGYHIEAYCKEIRARAREYGCRIIELYEAIQTLDTIDGAHPNAEGMKALAKATLSQL